MGDVQRALQREHAILRAVFGESDPRTQLVAGALTCGDAGVMAAVLAMRDRAVDGAKGLAAIKEQLLEEAKGAPLARYAFMDAAIEDTASVRAMDRVGVGVRSAYSLDRVPVARLTINPRCGNSGLLGPVLAHMRDRLGDALDRFEETGREEMIKALG